MSFKFSAVLSLLAVLAFVSLVSGGEYLEGTLPGGLPVGNALAAIGLCCAAAAALGLSVPKTLVRTLAVAAFAAAILWLPVSVALAGNLDLSFRGTRGTVWIGLSLLTASMVSGALIWALVGAFWRRIRRA